MNPKSLSGFEPTEVRGKWFEVNDLNDSAMDTSLNTDNKVLKIHSNHLHLITKINNKNRVTYLIFFRTADLDIEVMI
jgi:hypothetical protein